MKSTAPQRIVPMYEGLPQFGPYHVIERLGRGGMAEVFRAFVIHEGAVREVVVKRMRPELCADESAVARFSLEAQIARRLQHPNLVRGIDFGLFTDGHVLVLEYVDGLDVGRICALRGCGVPWPAALSVGLPIAWALAWAHQLRDDAGRPLRLVHRDVSPSNVMISRDGRVKLLDFGIAKLLNVHGPASLKGQVCGKIGYMAPEQLAGEVVDARCDQYSLGVVLYELMIGARLFGDQLGKEVLARRRQPVLAPSRVVPEADVEIDGLMLRLLAPDPVDRFASCSDAALAMTEALRGQGVPSSSLAELVAQCEQIERESEFDRAPDTVRSESCPRHA